MARRDIFIMFMVCLAWAVNTVVSGIIIVDYAVPPLLYALLRFGLTALLLCALLRPLPKPGLMMMLAGTLLGGVHYGLLFMGLRFISAADASIILQLIIPTTTLLSMLFLGEKLNAKRCAGITLALCGVLLVLFRTGSISYPNIGVLWMVAAVLAFSVGTILLKRVEVTSPLRLQSWAALSSLPPLALASAVLEYPQWPQIFAAGWVLIAAVVFSALFVTILATSLFYGLVQRYEGNLISALTLMMPLQTVALGVAVNGDRIDLNMVCGALMAVAGVALVLYGKQASPIPANVTLDKRMGSDL